MVELILQETHTRTHIETKHIESDSTTQARRNNITVHTYSNL